MKDFLLGVAVFFCVACVGDAFDVITAVKSFFN